MDEAAVDGRLQPERQSPEAFKASVLVIDDEPSFGFAISEILSLMGLEVHRAFNVDQALTILSESVPDLILTDIMMPGVDGLTFLRRLRADPKLANVPKIAITAMAMKLDREKALQAGADEYLIKPFSAKELQDAIRPFLNGTN